MLKKRRETVFQDIERILAMRITFPREVQHAVEQLSLNSGLCWLNQNSPHIIIKLAFSSTASFDHIRLDRVVSEYVPLTPENAMLHLLLDQSPSLTLNCSLMATGEKRLQLLRALGGNNAMQGYGCVLTIGLLSVTKKRDIYLHRFLV
jgi:hypothetical protein